MAHPIETPPSDCALCPRLVAFRRSNRATHPDWHNAPVPSFGDGPVSLLIVGLAPGLRGANRTGRPFTGDHAGGLLYATLRTFALAKGTYDASADDGLRLVGTRISNAVRCVPPKNRPTAIEVAACRPFLISEIQGLPDLKVILALGLLAHAAVLTALGLGRSARPFRHGALHPLPLGRVLADSYHCSRYNTSTGVLTGPMFEAVFEGLLPILGHRQGRARR